MPFQAQQICNMACQVAKAPSWTSQAGIFLNMTLSELCTGYDLAVARAVFKFNFNSSTGNQQGPYTLPLNWLRPDKDNIYYDISGVKYAMVPISLGEYNSLVQQPGLQAYPSQYAVDNGPIGLQQAPVMWVWPPPSGSFPVTVYYYQQMSDIATPEVSTVIPWFPNQLYLLRRVTGEMMLLTNDDRAEKFLGSGSTQEADGSEFLGAAAILDRYLKNKDDAQVVHTVTLDGRLFRMRNWDRLGNTKTIGW